MRNILALVGLATVSFLGAGWYLGWYEISAIPSPNGKQTFQVDIKPKKIVEDGKKGAEKLSEIVDSLRDKANQTTKEQSGPASGFFTQESSAKDNSGGGWTPIGGNSPQVPKQNPFGINPPR